MFNPKISGVIAGIAFTLSFLTGLFTGSQFFPVLLRAFILGIVFFVLSSLVYWVISRFLPELLTSFPDESGETDVPGSKIDISIDASDEEPETENSGNTEPGNSVPPIQGLDQKRQDDYNKEEVVFSAVDSVKTTAVPETDSVESVDVLPDLELMSGSFAQTEESDDESEVAEMEDDLLPSTPSMSGPSRKQKNSDPGDFNVQEMASAIQTILRRDEKG